MAGTEPGADKAEVCRTCLGAQALAPLFPEPEQYRSFQLALRLCTGLQMEQDDGLPQKICKNCIKVVEFSVRFRNQCRKAEKKLLNTYKRINKAENSNTNTKNNKQIPLNKEDGFFALENRIGIYTTSKKIIIDKCDNNKKADEYDPSDEEMFPKNVDDPNPVTKHDPCLDFIDGPFDRMRPIKCNSCMKTLKNIYSFRIHVRAHLGTRFVQCEQCGRKFSSSPRLLRHKCLVHGLPKSARFACTYCDFVALDDEQLEVHERRVHTKERPFVCDYCDAAFYSKRVLKQHKVRHTHETPFQCDRCSKQFKWRSRLTEHLHRMHNNRTGNNYKPITQLIN